MTASTIESLRAEVETLRETVRQYRDAIRPQVMTPPEWRLAHKEASFLLALYAAGTGLVTTERMGLVVWGVDSEYCPGSMSQLCYRLRRRLSKAGVQIRIYVEWSRGWRLDAESFEVLRSAIEGGSYVERT